MRDLLVQVCGQVDNVNGAKRTLLWTDTTTDTQGFRYKGNFALWRHLNTQLTRSHHRTRLFTLLSAFLWFTLVRVDNGDSKLHVSPYST